MKKRALSWILIFLLVLSLLSGCSFSAKRPSAEEGISFRADEIYQKYGDDIYYSQKPLSAVPHTFEGWILVPQEQKGTGVVYGNYDGHTSYYLNVAVTNGAPCFYWRDYNKTSYEIVFDEVDLRTGEYLHLTIVNDSSQGTAFCYVDGVLMQKKACPEFTKDIIKPCFALGGNRRKVNQSYFTGKIKSFCVFSDARSEKQIQKDIRKVKTGETLLAYYEAEKDGQTVPDLSGNGCDLYYSNLWLTEEEAQTANKSDGEFTIAVIGDTQYMSRYNPDKLPVMYKWIADNAQSRNIKYVIGLGDITDTDDRKEWDVARDAVSLLNGKVEYSLVRGNHDVKEGGAIFDEYFAKDGYLKQFEDFGGFYEEGSVVNTWRKLEIGDAKFLTVNLDYSPSEQVLEWAGEVIKANPDYRVIISTHAYLHSDGTHLSIGDRVWEKLASLYENVDLVLSGHVSCNEIQKRQLIGKNGNTVTELLIDAQDYDKLLGGLGMVALFSFSKDGSTFDVQYYSTVLDRYYRHYNNFNVDLEAEGIPLQKDIFNGISVKPEGEGSKASPYIVSEAGNLRWMANNIKATAEKGSFEGVYFKQTKDIDLDGKVLNSIGHYYFSSDTEMYAFGGVYDGGGFKISNGIIYGNNTENEYAFNKECGYGLFGMLYGGVVKNVVLDNVTVVGSGVTGAIVGKAAGDSRGSSISSFNRIENCTVLESCKILPYLPRTMTKDADAKFDSSRYAGIFGGIVGQARSATVKDCKFFGTVCPADVADAVGGIAGSAGYNSEILGCEYGGTVKESFEKEGFVFEEIMGFASPNESTADVGDNCIGTVTIS